MTFEKLNLYVTNFIVIGVIKNNKYLLNPKKDLIINLEDKIISIMEQKKRSFH